MQILFTSTLAEMIAGFHALSESLLIQVLELLRQQELCGCELCSYLGVTQSKLPFHPKTLDVGLVCAQQHGD